MSFEVTMLAAVILLTVAIVYGVPIPFAFAAPVVLIVLVRDINPQMLLITTFGKVNSVVLLAIPFFVMAGGVMEKGRIGGLLIDWVECFTSRIKGGLVVVTAVASAIFGSICGSGTATIACIGSIVGPRMKAKNYNPGIMAAIICCSGPLGLLIPPSAIQILYAWSTDQSVLACFLSTAIPGVILTTLLSIVSYILIKKDPNIPEVIHMPMKERRTHLIRTSKKSFPALLMPLIVLGGIYGGIMTPSEAAAVSVIYAIPVAMFYYKAMGLKELKEALTEAGITTGVMFMLLTFVSILSRLFLQEGLPGIITRILTSISDEKWAILIMINLILLVLGMITDDICGTLISAPILVPVCISIGVSPIHMAAILGVNLGMGNITPPCAPFIYFTSRITGVPAASIMKYSFILIIFCYIPVLILTTYIPGLALWLPQAILGDKLVL
jgi:tripartite ATP-independent transporter DctM subunit